MGLLIAPHLTQRTYAWTAFKAIELVKGGILQYEDDGEKYTVWFYDGPEVIVCVVWKIPLSDGVIAGGYTQDQATADKDEFEANFKPTANGAIEPKASDGRQAVCVTTAKRTKNFQLRPFTFYTSHTDQIHNFDPLTDADFGDVAVTLWRWNGSAWVSASAGEATKTVIDWDPLYPLELIGGWAEVPTDLAGGTTDEWYLSCVALPDYVGYGLAVAFVPEVNLEAVNNRKVTSDGRATQYLSPTIAGGVNYHTNRLRWTVKHPAGAEKRFQIFVESFR